MTTGRRRARAAVFLALGLGSAARVSCGEGQAPLTAIHDIRALPAGDGAAGLPVRLDATVTFYHADWGVLFVNDGKDDIYVGVAPRNRPARPFRAGQRLRLEGVAGPGEFLPVVLADRLEVTGSGPLPPFRKVDAEALFEPGMDCHPVEVVAVVKSTSLVEQSLVLELQVDGWRLKSILPEASAEGQLPWQLVERRVRVRGVVGTHFNDQRQMSGRLLYVPDLESITVDEPDVAVGAVPLVPVDGLLRADAPLRQRVRVRGVVTHAVPRAGLYLRGQGGSMFVQTAQPVVVARGDVVEAEGYPAVRAFRPSLNAVDVRSLDKKESPQPVPFVLARTRNSREQCELVTLEAVVLEASERSDGGALLCGADGQVFESWLSPEAGDIPALEPGTRVRLAGICEFESTRPLEIPRNATAFRIRLRDSRDVVVLRAAPWWQSRRALWVLGVTGGLALLIGGWAVALQVLVRRQSGIIRQQARQQATMDERQRIARDLHDTLEQELAGVGMLLDTAAKKLPATPPQAGDTLNLARRLLRRVRQESRSTIREMRSVTLEQRGLVAAMDELVRPLAEARGIGFTMQVSGEPRRLPGMVETHCLRVVQEAVANAARHSGAKVIAVQLAYESGQICIEVQDDGQGFDPSAASAAEGHFGLSGMRERADKLRAELRIKSLPGGGTTITLRVPDGPPADPET